VTGIGTRRREHSHNSADLCDFNEARISGPRLELFARGERPS
jgi:hypothetical protein